MNDTPNYQYSIGLKKYNKWYYENILKPRKPCKRLTGRKKEIMKTPIFNVKTSDKKEDLIIEF